MISNDQTRCACGADNANDAKFCRRCGAAVGGDLRQRDEVLDEGRAEPAVATGLSWKWVFLGVAIIFGTGFGLGIVAGLALAIGGIDEPPTWLLGLIGVSFFGLGGYMVGRLSPGKTIIEPGISAFIAVSLSLYFQGNFDLAGVVVGGLPLFAIACLGAWLGEKVQGTI